jgi:hypothetical protein
MILFTRRNTSRCLGVPIVTLATVLAALISPAIAQAASPSNDDFDAAVAIDALPFHTTQATVDATSAADDPISCTNNGSVWFSFTPTTNQTISADTFGSGYDTVLSAYTGSRGSLGLVPGACNDDSAGAQSRIVFPAVAGTTYHFMVGFCCGNGGTGGGNLTFSVTSVQTPVNDNFANALAIPGVPFTDTVDLATTSAEAGEPVSSCGNGGHTAWYSFTPAETASVTVTADSNSFSILTVFTGSSLASLTQVTCRTFGSPLTVRAVAGQTFYFRIDDFGGSNSSVTRLSLGAAPEVRAQYFFSPFDPSSFDQIRFDDVSSDPGGDQITTREWQFGDGASSTDTFPTHRYAADGDYSARLTVTTSDGRSASTTQVIHVRTHDVAINRFTVPASGRAGQTKAITVDVRNNRYDDMVRVELYKSTPNGFVLVGSLTQLVVARTTTRTTEFPFNYTFTGDDATLGKITFRAVAVLLDSRDALPGDNEVIATPTKVTP